MKDADWLTTIRVRIAREFYSWAIFVMPRPYKHLLIKHITNFLIDIVELHKGDMV